MFRDPAGIQDASGTANAIFPNICRFVVPDSLITYNWANPTHESPELRCVVTCDEVP